MTAEEQVRGTREEGQSVTDLIGNPPSQRRGVPTILAQQDIWRLLTSSPAKSDTTTRSTACPQPSYFVL